MNVYLHKQFSIKFIIALIMLKVLYNLIKILIFILILGYQGKKNLSKKILNINIKMTLQLLIFNT